MPLNQLKWSLCLNLYIDCGTLSFLNVWRNTRLIVNNSQSHCLLEMFVFYCSASAHLLSLQSLLELQSERFGLRHPVPHHVCTRMHWAHTTHPREATLLVHLAHHGIKPRSWLPLHGTGSRTSTRVGTGTISALHSHGRGARVALSVHRLGGFHSHRGVGTQTRTREGVWRRRLVWTMTLNREKDGWMVAVIYIHRLVYLGPLFNCNSNI